MDPLRPSSSSSSSKRPCSGDLSPAGDTRISPNSDSIDSSLVSLLSLRDPSVSIDLSVQRILDSAAQEMEKEKLIENAMRVALAIREAAIRSARRRASMNNAVSWPLPSDLTVKVFSMLDTRSLCHAVAACSMFSKCAGDPLCYCNIDLTAKDPKINNTVVSSMIQRAGKNLQSLKLGLWPNPVTNEDVIRCTHYSSRNSMELLGLSWSDRRPRLGKEPCLLTRSCLLALSADGATAGALLRSLHLYNIDKMDGPAFSVALSVCPSLLDLEAVGLCIELKQILDSVGANCHSIERLFVESSETGSDDSLKSPTCVDFVNGCPQIMSLTLRGFKMNDHKIRILIKVLRSTPKWYQSRHPWRRVAGNLGRRRPIVDDPHKKRKEPSNGSWMRLLNRFNNSSSKLGGSYAPFFTLNNDPNTIVKLCWQMARIGGKLRSRLGRLEAEPQCASQR